MFQALRANYILSLGQDGQRVCCGWPSGNWRSCGNSDMCGPIHQSWHGPSSPPGCLTDESRELSRRSSTFHSSYVHCPSRICSIISFHTHTRPSSSLVSFQDIVLLQLAPACNTILHHLLCFCPNLNVLTPPTLCLSSTYFVQTRYSPGPPPGIREQRTS